MKLSPTEHSGTCFQVYICVVCMVYKSLLLLLWNLLWNLAMMWLINLYKGANSNVPMIIHLVLWNRNRLATSITLLNSKRRGEIKQPDYHISLLHCSTLYYIVFHDFFIALYKLLSSWHKTFYLFLSVHFILLGIDVITSVSTLIIWVPCGWKSFVYSEHGWMCSLNIVFIFLPCVY